MFINKLKEKSGLGIVEVIVVVALIATTFIAVLQLSFLERRAQNLAREDTAAYILARESLEATRSIRDEDWTTNISSLVFNTPYYPIVNSGVWALTGTDPGSVGSIYTRWIEVSEVFRDGNDDIAIVGTSDSDTRLIEAYVSWVTAGGKTRVIEIDTYLTNWQSYQ